MGIRKTNEQFLEEFNNLNANIELLGDYVDVYTKIPCRCIIHDYKWSMLPSNLLKGRRCPLCAKNKIVYGYNDLLTVRPDLAKYIINKEDVKNEGVMSKRKIDVICPDCGHIKRISICQLTTIGICCPRCSDGISYPNKFSRALLDQLPVTNVCYEWSPDWVGNYRYDNYFEYQGQAYILEMDGRFHYEDNKMNNISCTEQREIDMLKETLAIQHDIIVIRIDSRKSQLDYIKENIENSLLGILFDLSSISWIQCDKFASKSILFDICKYYQETDNKNTLHISNVFNLSRASIIEYLKRGHEIGACDYTSELAEKERIESSIGKIKRNVIVTDSNNVEIGRFDSIKSCSNSLQDLYGNHYDTSSISKVCRGKYKSYKGLYFKYAS